MAGVEISLEWYEVAMAMGVASRRIANATQHKMHHKYGYTGGNALLNNSLGALSECAVAKYLGVYWNGSVGTFKSGGDVDIVQVRATDNAHGNLIVQADDQPGAPFVLVRVLSETRYELVGWLMGKEAQQKKFSKTLVEGRPPVFLVPDRDLYDMEALRSRMLATIKRRHIQEAAAVV